MTAFCKKLSEDVWCAILRYADCWMAECDGFKVEYRVTFPNGNSIHVFPHDSIPVRWMMDAIEDDVSIGLTDLTEAEVLARCIDIFYNEYLSC